MVTPADQEVIKKVLEEAGGAREFIAGPRPTSPIAGAYHDHANWVCKSYANTPEWVKTAATVAGAPNVALGMGEVCGEVLGEDGLPVAEIPFTGGQCPGVLYRAFAVRVRNNGNGPPVDAACQYFNDGELQVATGLVGPVGGLSSVVEPSGLPGVSIRRWFITHAGGEFSLGGFFTGCPDAGFSALRLVRQDGQPDNCGNPPSEFSPGPGAPPDPGDDPGGGQPPIWIPGVGPIFQPGPIDTPFGPVELPPIDPFEPNPTPTAPSPPPPGDQGEPGEPEDAGPDGEAEGEAPPGEVLVGLKINLTSIPDYAREYAAGVYRAPCYIYMGGVEGLDQDYAGSMIKDGQFVHAEKDNLTKWLVYANTGYSIRVTPYYREVEE